MSTLPVITISRQYGSGGRQIGKQLAEALQIPFYDNELITLAAQESGFDKKMFEDADKAAYSSLLFSLSMYGGSVASAGGKFAMPLPDRVYLIQSDLIRKLAGEGPCVIVGRCADYILRKEKNCLSVFLRAPQADRVRRAVDEYGDDLNSAAEKLAKLDKKRSVYYAHYTGDQWGASSHYDLILNTSAFGIDGTVSLIEAAARSIEL
jgi:CMP/dCMP kinase